MIPVKIAVGMSGGVDSSLVAALLVEGGHDVLGVTMCIGGDPSRDDNARRAQNVCRHLGIPHRVVDLRREFGRKVLGPFAAEYASGRTPNPCVLCNALIKFGSLFDALAEEDVGALATGHYVRKVTHPDSGWHYLRRASDESKDQSYVLHRLDQKRLGRALFPLGDWTKEETRAAARRMDLPASDAEESQEICFVPGDYRDFLEDLGVCGKPGPVVDVRGCVLGEHRGLHAYTVGQRRGLGIAADEPLYVLRLVPGDNSIVVGPRPRLLSTGARVEDVNWMVPEGELADEFAAEVAIRYNADPVTASIRRKGPSSMEVQFSEPRAAVTPGQSAVMYRGDLLIGGGFIRASIPEYGEGAGDAPEAREGSG